MSWLTWFKTGSVYTKTKSGSIRQHGESKLDLYMCWTALTLFPRPLPLSHARKWWEAGQGPENKAESAWAVKTGATHVLDSSTSGSMILLHRRKKQQNDLEICLVSMYLWMYVFIHCMIVATCERSLRKYWNSSGWSGLSQPIYVSADLPNFGFVYVSRLNCDLILGVWITECNPKALKPYLKLKFGANIS